MFNYSSLKLIFKVFMNLCVLFFLYKLFTSHPIDKNRDSNFHNHNVKVTRKSSTFYPGHSQSTDHGHVFLERSFVGEHSHEGGEAPLTPSFNYDSKNVYKAGYDIQLEYFFKVFITIIVLSCAFVGTNAL